MTSCGFFDSSKRLVLQQNHPDRKPPKQGLGFHAQVGAVNPQVPPFQLPLCMAGTQKTGNHNLLRKVSLQHPWLFGGFPPPNKKTAAKSTSRVLGLLRRVFDLRSGRTPWALSSCNSSGAGCPRGPGERWTWRSALCRWRRSAACGRKAGGQAPVPGGANGA